MVHCTYICYIKGRVGGEGGKDGKDEKEATRCVPFTVVRKDLLIVAARRRRRTNSTTRFLFKPLEKVAESFDRDEIYNEIPCRPRYAFCPGYLLP